MPVKLYHNILSPPCRAVRMCAKTIGVELEEKELDLLKGEQMEADFLEINPCHCVPTIQDDGFALWESRAINVYLNDKYSETPEKLYPTDPVKRAKVDHMLQFDLCSYSPAVTGYIGPQLFFGKDPDEEKGKKLKEMLDAFNKLLEGRNYAAGDELSLADFSLAATSGMLAMIKYDASSYTNIMAWHDRMFAVPAVKELTGQMLAKWVEFKAESG